jgi:glycosyltransferase involved in cell wall biosynthesis
MPELYRQADLFLHMSRDEPSALSYLEAASSGLSIVVHDSPVTRWTLAQTALYADTADPAAVARAVATGLEPATAARLAAATRMRVLDGWSWETLARRYLAFFQFLHTPAVVPERCGETIPSENR